MDRHTINSSLLGISKVDYMSAFNHEYRNFGIKMGAIIEVYNIDHEKNESKFMPEYDVVVVEQNANLGATSSIYHNCISASSFGSFADFFEAKLRPSTKPDIKKDLDPNKHDGSFVLLACIDGCSEKGVIIGCLPDPNRPTTLTKESDKHLEGEFNGINFQINKDGEFTIRFKSPTNNDGEYLEEEDKDTFVKLEKDRTLKVKSEQIDTESLTVDVRAEHISTESETVKVKADKVAIGSDATELLQQICDSLDKIIEWANNTGSAHMHIGNMGYPTAPPTEAPMYVQLGTELTQIKSAIEGIKGDL